MKMKNILSEKGKGLWHNIHAKKKRGEKSDPRSKSYKAAVKAGEKIRRSETTKDGVNVPAPPNVTGLLNANMDELLMDINDPKTLKELAKKLYEKLVFYRDKQKRIRRFDTEKSKNDKLRK
tara:strand:- start:463 stop:825 length:363 start_codon:yes stop_codon:yes gene_type:complete